jgi:hypothetical protein
MSVSNDDEPIFDDESGSPARPLEGDVILGESIVTIGSPSATHTTRNVLIAVAVVVSLMICCCCTVAAVIFASGLPTEIMREFGLTTLNFFKGLI